MFAAIHARTLQLHSNLHRVLAVLHEQKKAPGVEAMLQRLYQPILWCSTNAPNAQVRRNAYSILLDVFPISVRYSSAVVPVTTWRG
jgi:hypothetical protein